MNAKRARVVLSALGDGEADPSLNQEEQSELVKLGLIRSVDRSSKRLLEDSVREMDLIASNVRRMTRNLDSMRSGGINWQAGSPNQEQEFTREQLQTSLSKLEELARKKATLDSLTLNDKTDSYLMLTLEGRRARVELDAWHVRFGDLPIVDFLGKMTALKSHMMSRVRVASRTVKSFRSPERGVIMPELRGPALLMADLGKDAERLAKVMGRSPSPYGIDESSGKGDMMLEATLLASSQGGTEAVLSRYQKIQEDVRDDDPWSEDDGVKALSLMNLTPGERGSMVERMNWIRTNMVIPNSTDVSWLASSDYPVDEIRARYEAIMDHLTRSEFGEDSHLRSACAIMAGSSYPVETIEKRYGELIAELGGTIESPKVAAAMLASGPLEPYEVIHVFREAIGVVSRESYFDDAREIENLALLLTRKLDPEIVPDIPYAISAPLAAAGVPDVEETRRTESREISWYYWYYWTHRHYFHTTLHDIRAHPGHMHTVPYFG